MPKSWPGWRSYAMNESAYERAPSSPARRKKPFSWPLALNLGLLVLAAIVTGVALATW